MPETSAATSYWEVMAGCYAALGPPLRPSHEDIQVMERAIRDWSAEFAHRSLRALLLGVTPDIARMTWPARSLLAAIDISIPMARGVWPGNIPGKQAVVCADWQALPVRDASCHVVAGDGSLSCLRYPQGFLAVLSSVRRALCDEGMFLVRCYVQSEVPESPAAVFEDMFEGAIPSFHEFKLRLLMALQRRAADGVAVESAYQHWASYGFDAVEVSERTGWEPDAIRMIDLYRESETVYSFPTFSQLRSVIRDHFEEITVIGTSNGAGGRCPILICRPRRNRE
jgi:hypothetical protein